MERRGLGDETHRADENSLEQKLAAESFGDDRIAQVQLLAACSPRGTRRWNSAAAAGS